MRSILASIGAVAALATANTGMHLVHAEVDTSRATTLGDYRFDGPSVIDQENAPPRRHLLEDPDRITSLGQKFGVPLSVMPSRRLRSDLSKGDLPDELYSQLKAIHEPRRIMIAEIQSPQVIIGRPANDLDIWAIPVITRRGSKQLGPDDMAWLEQIDDAPSYYDCELVVYPVQLAA